MIMCSLTNSIAVENVFIPSSHHPLPEGATLRLQKATFQGRKANSGSRSSHKQELSFAGERRGKIDLTAIKRKNVF